MDNLTWVLVADAARAVIFRAHKAKLFDGDGNALTFINRLEHPESRLRDQDLVSDKQGRFGNATFSEPTDPKKHQEDIFAAEIAKILQQGHYEKKYAELIFVAPVPFMGMVDNHLTKDILNLICLRVEKDFTLNTQEEIVKHLQIYL